MHYVDDLADLRATPPVERRKRDRRERRRRGRRRTSLLGRALLLLWSIISLLWTGLVAILVFRVWAAPAGSDRLLPGLAIWLALGWLPVMAAFGLGRSMPRLLGRWRRRSSDLRQRIEAYIGNDPF